MGEWEGTDPELEVGDKRGAGILVAVGNIAVLPKRREEEGSPALRMRSRGRGRGPCEVPDIEDVGKDGSKA